MIGKNIVTSVSPRENPSGLKIAISLVRLSETGGQLWSEEANTGCLLGFHLTTDSMFAHTQIPRVENIVSFSKYPFRIISFWPKHGQY